MPEEVSIVVCGPAGQGIKTVESLLAATVKAAGFRVFTAKEYMSRVRGGMNSTQVLISSRRLRSPLERIDVLVSFGPGGIEHLRERIGPRTLVLADAAPEGEDAAREGIFRKIPWQGIAGEIGGEFYANTVAVGALASLLGFPEAAASASVERFFSGKEEKVRQNNLRALARGFALGGGLKKDLSASLALSPGESPAGEVLLSGTEATALGAIAGGCNFLSFYPMSPATGVGTYLAAAADEFGLEVEQAEDEISALNMNLGAWYAGARGLVTTSGGGFALMVEGLSLAGMIETPCVIHLGQRPGPATGLPTRSEQGDLLFVLFAGHGEFPRIIFAPGSVEEAFYLARKAFNLAAKFQVPVFLLTDQFLLDAVSTVAPLDPSGFKVEKHIVRTASGYRRYELSPGGVSPRGIPGWGEGLVCADSDEHDESGHITEDSRTRVRMVEKRLAKLDSLRAEAVPPEFHGDQDYRVLVAGWGSTRGPVLDALERMGGRGIGYLHFSQVYPLAPAGLERLQKAPRLVVVENNATGQFGSLIRLEAARTADRNILKDDGRPFSREALEAVLAEEAAR